MFCRAQYSTPWSSNILTVAGTFSATPSRNGGGEPTTVSVMTRSGRRAAKARATVPPILAPTRWKRSMPRWSISRQKSSTSRSSVHGYSRGIGARLAEPAHVGPHHAILPRQGRDPPPPGEPALGVAVQHQHGLGLGPRVGEIVDLVMHLAIGRGAECRHGVSPSFSTVLALERSDLVPPEPHCVELAASLRSPQ